jgi:hypothetical protein
MESWPVHALCLVRDALCYDVTAQSHTTDSQMSSDELIFNDVNGSCCHVQSLGKIQLLAKESLRHERK